MTTQNPQRETLFDLARQPGSKIVAAEDTLPYGFAIVMVYVSADNQRRLIGGILQWIPVLLQHLRQGAQQSLPSGADLRIHRVETIHAPSPRYGSHVSVLIEIADVPQDVLWRQTAALPLVAAKWVLAAVAVAGAASLMVGLTISLFKVSDRLAEALIRPVESVAEEVGEAARWAVPVVVGLLVLWAFTLTAGRGTGAWLKSALSGRAQARG